MEEWATYMYKGVPLVRVSFVDGRVKSKNNLNSIEGRFELNWVHDLNESEFEAYLLDRRIASGRPNRQERYFGGRYDLTPYEEMKIYRAADIDDYCWLKYDGLDDNVRWEEMFGWIV